VKTERTQHRDEPRRCTHWRGLRLAACIAATLTLASCSEQESPDVDTFLREAKELGYRCLETEPPRDSIVLMWTCKDLEDQKLALTAFTTEEHRKSTQNSVTEDQTVVAGDLWYLAGDNSEAVKSIATALGGSP
jgi:hypothetical protein